MPRIKDITGQRFGRLTVIEYAGLDTCNMALWRCKCDCGKETVTRGSSLRNGHTISCGCYNREKCAEGAFKKSFKDLTGSQFGNLTVIKYVGNRRYLCKCDCGRQSVTYSYNLTKGIAKSCGCRKLEGLNEYRSSKHGKSGERIYTIWANMKKRCSNKNNDEYKSYGGRGISVCEEWYKFENFYRWAIESGYSDDLTIERIDVNGNYEPGNCKWIPHSEQAKNKRNTIHVKVGGETKTIGEWSKLYGVKYYTIRHRLIKGWDAEMAVKTLPNGRIE